MIQEKTTQGYMAFAPNGKMLRNYWSGGSQTGTNKQSLTDDPQKATIADTQAMIKIYAAWYNNSHRTQIDFEIKYVELKVVTTTTLTND